VRPMSLAWRIRLLVTLVVTVIVSAVCGTAYLRFRVAYLGHIDRMLEVMSNGAVAAVEGAAGSDSCRRALRRSHSRRPAHQPPATTAATSGAARSEWLRPRCEKT